MVPSACSPRCLRFHSQGDAPAPAPSSSLTLAPGFAPAPAPGEEGSTTSRRLKYKGVGTVGYSSSPLSNFGASNMGCALGYVNDNFTTNYVSVGPSFFNQGYSCGLCLQLQCDDASCAEPGRREIVQVVDYCGNCYDADLTIATPLFTRLTGRAPLPNPSALVSWQWVDCAPYTNGTIKMLVKTGGNAYYQAVSFANSIYTITAAQLNGNNLVHGSDNYWSWNPTAAINPNGPFQLALLASDGQIKQLTLPALQSTDLGFQWTAAAAEPAAEQTAG